MAKRVNVRFLTILTSVVVAIAIAVVVSKWAYGKLVRHDPKYWIAMGDADTAKGDWQSAVDNYGEALQHDRTNKSLCVTLGDAWNHLASLDQQNIAKARAAWNQALEIDPQYVPALQRLLTMDRQIIELSPNAQAVYGDLRDVSRRLAQAEPSDPSAQDDVNIATIQQWLANGPVSDGDFQHSLSAMQGMLKKDPANPELVYNLGRVYLTQSARALKQGASSDVIDNYDNQARAVVDAALALKPKDAALNLRAFEVYDMLARAAHLTSQRDAAAASAAQAIADAYANAKPTDSSYPQIVELVCQWDIHQGKKDQAETVMRAYNAKFPDDLGARINYANALAEVFNKRDEAIALLSAPITNPMEPGPQGQMFRNYQTTALVALTGMEIDQCESITDSAERQKLLDKIGPQVAQLFDLAPDNAAVLRMKGTLEAMLGQRYAAIETLSKARHILEASSSRNPRLYFGVLYSLGMAYLEEGQDASAEKTLELAVQIVPNFAPAQLRLTQLYLQDRNLELASLHFDAVAKADPNDPNLPRLRMALDEMNHHTGAAEQDYSKLPETTHGDRLLKAQIASNRGDLKEAARLLQLALSEKPNDPQISLALADVQNRLHHTDDAIATLESQLKLTPKNDAVTLVLKELQNAPAKEIDFYKGQILGGTSEFSRAVNTFEQDFNGHRYDEALTDLKTAEHIGGNDQLVAELYFQLYLARQQYDDAQGVIGTLARLNADDANGLTYQIHLDMARNHRNQAIEDAKKITGARPELAMSWVMLGDALQANGQYQDALQNYREALERQSLNSDALAGEINCYIALHDTDNASARIADARRLFPDSLLFRNLDLNYQMTYGKPEEVVAELQNNLAAHPDDPVNYLTFVEACMQTADTLSANSGDAGPRPYLNKAHDALAQALTKFPNDPRFVPLMGQVEQVTGDSAGALKLLTDFAALPRWKNRPEPQLFLADFYSRAGKPKEAEADIRAALALNKTDPDIQLKLARFLGGQGRFADALAALPESSSDPALVRERLELLINAGRFAEAESGLQAALAKAPENVNLLYLMSVLHAATGHFQDAEADAKQGLSIDPKNIPLLLQLARIDMTRPHGDLDLASRQLSALLQVDPKDLDATVMLSDLYVRQGQLDSAISEMETALKLAPLNKPLRIRLAKLYMSNEPPQWSQFDQLLHQAESNDQLSSDPSWLTLEATGLFKRQQVSDALAKMRQAQAMVPDDTNIEHQYLDLLLQAKQYSDAVQEIDRVLGTGKRLWWLHDMRGVALARQGQKTQALQEFQAALTMVDADGQRDPAAGIISTIGAEIGPDTALSVLQPHIGIDPGWRILAIQLYQSKGDDASALKLAEQVVADPVASSVQKLDATEAVAQCAARLNQFDKSKAAYLSWLDQNPNDVVALNNLACLLNDELNQPQEALQYSRQAYNLASQTGAKVSPLITDTQAWVLIRSGGDSAKTGISMLEQLVGDHPDFLDARYHLAEGYLQTGNNDGALAQLTAALDAIKTQEANHVAVSGELKKNISQAMTQAKQAAAKAEAAVH